MTAVTDLLMIAARVPTPGATKTRLGQGLGMAYAARIYTGFLRDIAAEFDRVPTNDVAWDLAWTFSPPEADFQAVLIGVIGQPSGAAHFVAQDGPDWGTRQLNLLRWGIDAGYRRVVLMASDSPQLTRNDLQPAFDALDGADVVIGRVHDGGYYLIGMAGFHDVISSVEMSTASAADGIVARAGELGVRMGEVAPTFDVDVMADLEVLQAFLDGHPERCSHTRQALAEVTTRTGDGR